MIASQKCIYTTELMLIVIWDCADKPISGEREYFDKALNSTNYRNGNKQTFRKSHAVAEPITKQEENEQN